MIRSGDLKHAIVIQEQTSVSDGMGGELITWSDLLPWRAAIWPLSAKEQLDALKLELVVNNRIRMRHPRINITADMRIKWHDHLTGTDKYFNMVSIINPDKRNQMLEFLATEET